MEREVGLDSSSFLHSRGYLRSRSRADSAVLVTRFRAPYDEVKVGMMTWEGAIGGKVKRSKM